MAKLTGCHHFNVPGVTVERLISGGSRGGGGGGGGGHPDPEIRRVSSPKTFFRPFGPQFGLNMRGRRAPGPLP